MNVSTTKTDKKFTISFITDSSEDIIVIEEEFSILVQVNTDINIEKDNGTLIPLVNGNTVSINPGSYLINIPASSFRDESLNKSNDASLNFTLTTLTPTMSDLIAIDNSALSNNITLSDKITFLPFSYSDLTITATSTSTYVNTIENINNGINILFNDSIQTTSRTTNPTFTVPIVFAVTYGNDTTILIRLNVTNIYSTNFSNYNIT